VAAGEGGVMMWLGRVTWHDGWLVTWHPVTEVWCRGWLAGDVAPGDSAVREMWCRGWLDCDGDRRGWLSCRCSSCKK
jgi:hypothetical protein